MLLANVFLHPSRVLAGCVLLALSGCANEALNQQLATSREAVDQAKMAGAAETVPADFDAAVDKLNRANAAAKQDKTGAMRLAQEAQVDANLARARTDSAQARTAAAELIKSNQILRETMIRANENQ
jgi:membrane-bound lytic murein transglycosylase